MRSGQGLLGSHLQAKRVRRWLPSCAPAHATTAVPTTQVCGKPAESADAGSGAGSGSGGGWLRVRAGQAAPYVATVPRSHITATVAAVSGASSRGAPDIANTPIMGPAEQAAAATRKEPHKTFVVKVQVRRSLLPAVCHQLRCLPLT